MIDINSLLLPVSATAPSGEDMSFSTEFDVIQEARRADDASLDQGEWVTELKESDWNKVRDQCIKLLTQQSKDLRLGMWLTEAMIKQEGFVGISQGFRLMTGLCDGFWSNVHPLPEHDDQEQRIGTLTWLLARCTQLLREIPVTDAPDMRYSTMDHESALQLSRLAAKNPSEAMALTEGRLTLEQIEKARRATPKEFYQRLLVQVRECSESLQQFERTVDARLGLEGPGFSSLWAALASVNELTERFARDAGLTETPANLTTVAIQNNIHSADDAHLSSRKQALQQLNQVAQFFKRTEPHSPVAYLVEKAVRWGEMPLHAWLRSVVKDPASLSHLEEMLGVQSQSPSEK